MPTTPHRGLFHRRYLPHRDTPDQAVAITYQLDDALPAHVVSALMREQPTDTQRRRRIEELLGSGIGSCLLRREGCAAIVIDAWRWFDGERYDLLAWVVMPNHVHVLVRQRRGWPLSSIVGGWKSFTAKAINGRVGSTGRVWHREYWDRTIRDDVHFARTVEYIHGNPVAAGLVDSPAKWRWSSAARTVVE